MKLRRVHLVLCPVLTCALFAQPAFDVDEPRPYTTGMKIALQYGAEAGHEYFKACHKQTGNDMCFFGLAYTWYMMGENEKSIEMVKYMVADPDVPDKFAGHCWALMGANLIYLQLFDEAEEPLKKALGFYEKANQPRNVYKVLTQLGNSKLRAGNLQAADAYFEEATFLAISEDVDRSHLYSLRAISAYTQGKIAAAQGFADLSFAEYSRAENREGMVDAKSYQSFYLYEGGNETAARTALKQAEELCKVYKTNATIWTVLVRAYIDKCAHQKQAEAAFETHLKNESGYFLLRFKELYQEKACP